MTSRREGRRGKRLVAVFLSMMLGVGVVVGWYAAYAPEISNMNTVAHILGLGPERRYLVLAQNPAELRPAGGYAGTVGVVGFDNFRLVEISFNDVYQLDLKPGTPYVEPPPELANHLLGSQSWQLADAAWSPDFPTAAQNALRLYELESGDNNIDGVIALNTYAVDRLLEVTGPIEVPEYGVTVAAGDVTLTALRLTRGVSTPMSHRKAFLDVLAGLMVDRLKALPAGHWPQLADALSEVAEQRSVLAWFKDPAAENAVANSPEGGAVLQNPGDYLYVVEANVEPSSKYNLVVDRTDALAVQLDLDGNATSDLQMTWQNNAMEPGEPYESIRSYSTNKNGLYGAYVRVLTPATSELVAAEGAGLDPISGVEESGTEVGRNVFGNYLLMGPGSSSLHYQWTTPDAATQGSGLWTYRLTIQRQPGLRPMPVSVVVTPPDGATVESVSAGAAATDSSVTFAATLDRDTQLEIRYRLP